MTEPKITGLAHICIRTRDLKKSLEFYINLLGFEKTYETRLPDFDYVLVKKGSMIIELLAPENKEKVIAGIDGTIDHFALEVTDIDAFVGRLKNKGFEIKDSVFTINNIENGIKGLFIRGPSGENIELFQHL